MNKIKIEQMKCFDEVAKVIGAEKARVELFKVVQKFTIKSCQRFTTDSLCNDRLKEAFLWEITEQGYDFWNDIDEGVNPYEE